MGYGNFGIMAGAGAKAFGEGIRDAAGLKDIQVAEQNRQIQEDAFKRMKEERAQADRAHAMEADQLYRKHTGQGIQVPDTTVAPGEAPSLPGGAEPATPGAAPAGAMQLGGAPAADGEVTKSTQGVTVQRTTKTPGAPAASARGVNHLTMSNTGLSLEEATRIYKQNPLVGRKLFVEAQNAENARIKFETERYDQQFVNAHRAAQTAGLHAQTESVRLQNTLTKMSLPNKQLELNRELAGGYVKVAGAQVQELDEGHGLTDPTHVNSKRSESAVAAVVQAMNAGQNLIGMNTTYKKTDNGYTLVTEMRDPKDGKSHVVRTSNLSTVAELKKAIGAVGVAALDENWNKYYAQATLAQETDLMQDLARQTAKGQRNQAALANMLTDTELANAPRTAAQMQKLEGLLAQPDAVFEKRGEILELIADITKSAPSLYEGTRTIKTKDAEGNEKSYTETYSKLEERYTRMIPPMQVQRYDKDGKPKIVNLEDAARAAGWNWEETQAKARKALKLDDNQPIPPEAMDAYINESLISMAPDPRSHRWLRKLVDKSRLAKQDAVAKAQTTPAGTQTQGAPVQELSKGQAVVRDFKALFGLNAQAGPTNPEAPTATGISPDVLRRMQYQR